MVRIGGYRSCSLRETTQYLHTSPTQPYAVDLHTKSYSNTGANTNPEHTGITNRCSTIKIECQPSTTRQHSIKGHGKTNLARTNLDTFLISLDLTFSWDISPSKYSYAGSTDSGSEEFGSWSLNSSQWHLQMNGQIFFPHRILYLFVHARIVSR
jgi:hypothetical protein